MKRDLLVGVAQWLAAPGEPRQNMSVALGMMDDAASRGVELLLLPELWSCGYDPETLARDARADAEPRDGPRSKRLGEAARRREMWLAAGSVPELGEDGLVYDTALVFNPRGELAAWHRKAHLYPPTLEPTIFTPGDRLTTFDDPALGRVGLVVCFDGDFPEVARTLALRGARLVLAPSAYEVEGGNAWDLLYPALALTNSQWWVQANQAGSHSTSTLLGASRIVAPTGTVVAEASRAVPGSSSRAELLVHRIDLHIAYAREGISGLLEDERRPGLYFDRVPAESLTRAAIAVALDVPRRSVSLMRVATTPGQARSSSRIGRLLGNGGVPFDDGCPARRDPCGPDREKVHDMLFMTEYRLKPQMSKSEVKVLMDEFGKRGAGQGEIAHYVRVDGSGGYTISEDEDMTAAYETALAYSQWLTFTVSPVLKIDDAVGPILAYLGS